LWITGWIEYLDAVEALRITSFCRRWCRDSHRLIPVDDPDYESTD
jgi:hypothetical protein